MFKLVCYSVEEIINLLNIGAYIAVDAHNDAYIIRGIDKIFISKDVFEYVISNYRITIDII